MGMVLLESKKDEQEPLAHGFMMSRGYANETQIYYLHEIPMNCVVDSS